MANYGQIIKRGRERCKELHITLTYYRSLPHTGGKDQIRLQLMETQSAGHVSYGLSKMLVNPILPFMSIQDAHPASKLLYQLVLIVCEFSPGSSKV